MMKRHDIIVWVLLVICTACETEIDYKGEELDNFMVLNANLRTDSVISCKISRSNTIFENNYIQSLNDVEMSLYCNGERIGLGNSPVTGNYFWTEKVTEGNEYSIKVEHPKYESINAFTVIPEKANAWVSDINQKENGREEVTVTIDDKPGKNFYRLLLLRGNKKDYDDTFGYGAGYSDVYRFSSNDPVLNYNKVVNEESSFSDYPENIHGIFNDELFDGKRYNLKFTPWGADDLVIDIQQISEDLYLYYRSIRYSDWYGEDPMVEPVRIHSNVNGGAGILGSTNSNLIYKEE
ncbi:MAG: DUF4249 domain-containing protein [Draconibacterium sp.]